MNNKKQIIMANACLLFAILAKFLYNRLCINSVRCIMTKNRIKLKSKIIATAVALFVSGSMGAVGLNSLKKSDNLLADTITDVSVSNGTFSSSSGGAPGAPTSWTGVKNYNLGNAKSGVVDLTSDNQTIEDDYKLESLPNAFDADETTKKALMINANGEKLFGGYQTSSTISFEKNSHYKVTAQAFTFANSSTFGSISLVGNDNVEANKNSIVEINGTNGEWKTFSILVSTNQFEDLSLNIDLLLGEAGNTSTGTIFFDNVTVTKYDDEAFAKLAIGDETYSTLDLRQAQLATIDNASFETELASSWTVCDDVSAGNVVAGTFSLTNSKSQTSVADPENANLANNQKALLIYNKDNGYYGLKSKKFVIEQYKLYKLSFLAKTDSNAKATVKLCEENPYDNNVDYKPKTFAIDSISTSSYTNADTNNWKEYSFFVKGSPYFDEQLHIELWNGTSESSSIGYVWFDNITLTPITSSQYTNNLSDGTEANLSATASETDISNANFNLVTIDNLKKNYPYAPQNWSLSNETDNSVVAVVNTNLYNGSVTNSSVPLLENEKYNNVLMIHNIDYTSQVVTSNSTSLSSDSYYKVEAYALTQNLTGFASVSLVGDGDVLLSSHNQIASENWTKYSFFVKTGFTSQSVQVALGLGKDTSALGFAFFDKVLVTKFDDEDAFESALKSADANSKTIDLTKINFSNVGSLLQDDIYASKDFESELVSGESATAVAGVKFNQNGNHIVISSKNDEVYYTMTSDRKISLSSGNYYKFEVTLKTENIVQNEKKTKGAKISLSGIGAQFSQIDTDGKEKTYTFYVKCTEDQTVNLLFALGNNDDLTQGYLEVLSASIEKIESDDYTNGIKVLQNDDSIDNVLAVGNTDSDDDGNSNDDKNSSNSGAEFNWLLVPSIITALAVIIAVVGSIIRQARRKTKKKPAIQTEYSKENVEKLKSVHKEEIANFKKQLKKLDENQTKIAEEINSLNAQDEVANAQKIAELKTKYNETKTKIAEMEKQKKTNEKKYKQKMQDLSEQKKADYNLKKQK